MQDLLVNGVPVFRPNGYAQGWLRGHSSLQALESLRRISLWSQALFGLPADHRLIAVLSVLCQAPGALQGAALTDLPSATGLDSSELQAVLQVLRARAQVDFRPGVEPGEDRVFPEARLVEAWMAFQQQVDGQCIARPALRKALLLNQASAQGLVQRVDALFDTFFDLGWLYLHNWGANCHLMASLVCLALEREGHRARVEIGYVEICQEAGRYLLGGKGLAQAGQLEGHAFCVVDDACVVDFGLGALRRLHRRDMFWAVAADALWASDVSARVEHPRCGVMSWRTDYQSPELRRELAHVEPLAQQLMAVYAAARPLSALGAVAAPVARALSPAAPAQPVAAGGLMPR